MKMRVLPSLMKKNLSAKMLGDYNMSSLSCTLTKSLDPSVPAWGLSGMAVKVVSFPTQCWKATSEPR